MRAVNITDPSTDPAVAFAMPSAGLDVQLYIGDGLLSADSTVAGLALAAAA